MTKQFLLAAAPPSPGAAAFCSNFRPKAKIIVRVRENAVWHMSVDLETASQKFFQLGFFFD